MCFTYDVRGRRITSTDQNRKTTTYTYDDADRLTAVTDPANNTTQYAYDTEDNLLSITDANSHTTQFAYNARGWVTQTTFPSTLAVHTRAWTRRMNSHHVLIQWGFTRKKARHTFAYSITRSRY
jgi:YD repeat-containing protein